MTDYELIASLNGFINTTWFIFATYVSIVFAFLVASYLVADRLAPKLVSVIVVLYSLVALWAVWGLNRTSDNLGASLARIKRQVLAGESSLSWLPGASVPDVLAAAVPIVVTVIAVVAYAGSIVFFFHQRKFHGSK